jgi:histidinol-phosphate/aromatic aminotransferase/cobyric acid decarboxylase-like protein
MVCLFADFENLLCGLFCDSGSSVSRLIMAGHVTPEIQLVAHKADRTLTEIVGVSPFTGDIESVLAALADPADTVIVSNPNRVTGTGWTLQELDCIAQAVPYGLLIIDEYYYDFHGISADPLFDRHGNIVILRSPALSVGITTDAGYLIAPPHLIDRLSQAGQVGAVSVADMKLLTESMYTAESLVGRLRIMHDESLRIVAELSQMGAHCRITPFNCLLIRVADPTAVGNHLARHKIAVDNLDGYPGLKNYIRVRIESPATNDRLIEAFRRLPEAAIQARQSRSQILRLRRPAEELERSGGLLPSVNRLERVKAFVSDKAKDEKAAV